MEFIDLKHQYENLKPSLNQRIEKVFNHGQFIMGPEVKELESALSSYVGVKHCITVGSGTDALLISLMALGIKPGDEIITTPFSFISTAEVIVLLGAIPIFVDIDAETCNINHKLIKEKLTSKTKAIIPVSLYGQPSNMDEINKIANENGNIAVIEDAAQSFGAIYKGRRSCNLSQIGCTSFFPSKPLGCYGDGGAIFTNDDHIAKLSRQIRIHGQSERYLHSVVGIGGRMDTLQCAIILSKFEVFEEELQRRRKNAERYYKLLNSDNFQKRNCFNLKTLAWPDDDRTSVFGQFTVLVNNRTAFQEKLRLQSIPTAVHYPTPINMQPAYENLCCKECTPITEEISNLVVSLPFGPDITEEQQDNVINAILS